MRVFGWAKRSRSSASIGSSRPGRWLHETAELNLTADIQRVLRARKSSADWAVAEHLFKLDAGYMQASDGMFRAVDDHKTALANHFDRSVKTSRSSRGSSSSRTRSKR
jgi:hypothetical protein